MITEDYVSFEVAKLLKEKWFNEPCWGYYVKSHVVHYFRPVKNSEWTSDKYSAPTLQMAMKWLREVHNLYIQVMLDSWAWGSHSGYYIVIQDITSDFEVINPDIVDNNSNECILFNTYEEACEAAIKYCLTNLI